MERTKRWLSLVRWLPTDLQMHLSLLTAVRADDVETIIRNLEWMASEAQRELNDFIESHPEERRLSRLNFYELTNSEKAQVEWYEEERGTRRGRLGRITDCIRFARDIAGIEPYWPPEPDDDQATA